MHPSSEKSQLREAIKQRLSHLSEKDRYAESRSVCRRVLEVLPPEPTAIAAYFPLKDEVDTRSLIEELLQKKYSVYLPRIENNKMVFRRIDSLESLPVGTWNIPEPLPTAPLLDPTTLAFALIPGRAFTKDGKRLGRGNGGYDIWIRSQRSLNPTTRYFGLALESQIVPDLPSEPHDEKVDHVITARGKV